MNYDDPRYTISLATNLLTSLESEAKKIAPTTPQEERMTRDSSGASPRWENLLNCPALAGGAKRLAFLIVASVGD